MLDKTAKVLLALVLLWSTPLLVLAKDPTFPSLNPNATAADDNPLINTVNNTPATNSTTEVTVAQPDTQGINNSAFQKLLNDYFPLSPEQIHQFKNAAAEQQQASAQPPGDAPPDGTSAIIPVTLKPGGIMPVIRIGSGMITSLVFIDASGQVWPITSYSVGDPASFNVQWDKKSGVLMVQGQKLYSQTNIGVMLQGLDIPVMLNLIIGQKKWDYLDYVQMDQNQPGDNNTPMPVAQAPAFLTDLLNGIPPQGAMQLNISDNTIAQVWSYQGQYIMVTKATLLSPAYISKADGPGSSPLHAYAFPQAPEILVSNFGTIQKLIISSGAPNASSN